MVAGGWWLVVGGWWLVVGGCWLLVGDGLAEIHKGNIETLWLCVRNQG